MKITIYTIAAMLLITSCAHRKTGLRLDTTKDQSNTISKLELQSKEKEAETLWNDRHILESLNKSLKIYEELAKSVESNKNYYVLLSRGQYFKAQFHEKDKEKQKKQWEKGAYYGELALVAENSSLKEAMVEGDKLEDHLDLVGQKDIGALYWTAANLGKWAKASGITSILRYKNRIRTLISKVEDLDPKYYYGAAYRYWGAYYAVAPGFAGGDLGKSKNYFEKSYKVNKQYLGTYVLEAEFYATKKQDKKHFKKILDEVVNIKLDKNFPDYADNYMAQKSAGELLSKINDLF